ncbi:MAG TPA: Plug domain-containing protein, partial [Longimicrobiales bacterium]|nr:Plug domain-containing protein [Longimicrobiales bacterium]
ERRPEARLSDFVREIPGVLVFMQGNRAAVEVRGSACTPDVFLDGISFDMDREVGLNQLFTQELEAIEVYKGQEVPGEFLKVGFQRPCRAIVIWSRRGT